MGLSERETSTYISHNEFKSCLGSDSYKLNIFSENDYTIPTTHRDYASRGLEISVLQPSGRYHSSHTLHMNSLKVTHWRKTVFIETYLAIIWISILIMVLNCPFSSGKCPSKTQWKTDVLSSRYDLMVYTNLFTLIFIVLLNLK